MCGTGQKSQTWGYPFLSGLLSLHSSAVMPSFFLGHREHVPLPNAMHVLDPHDPPVLHPPLPTVQPKFFSLDIQIKCHLPQETFPDFPILLLWSLMSIYLLQFFKDI